MYDFDEIIPRKNTNSMKWDKLEEVYQREDLLPMWVADMDFLVAPQITSALEKRIKHGIYGYTFCSDDYYASVINWMKDRHDFNIKKEWIVFTPGVVPAVSYAIRAFTDIGDSVIVQSPVYHPFYNSIKDNKRNVVTNPLIYKDGRYQMDYDDLERKIDSKTKLLILCSPHNPVGRVWTKEELSKLAEICLKNNIKIISDEIHFDIVYKDSKHTVLANISDEIMDNSIICTAPSKTFNIAGIQVSNIIIPNEKMRQRYVKELEVDHIGSPNSIAETVLIAAYNDSKDWLDSAVDYIEKNKDYFINYVNREIPQLKVIKPEGTYLLWVDCSGLGMDRDELRDFFVNKCKIAFNHGEMFGEEGKLFQRVNIACPLAIIEEALYKIKEAVNSLNIL